MKGKYNNFLTIILILIIIAIIAIIAFLGFKYYEVYISKTEAENFVETWGEDSENNQIDNDTSLLPPTDVEIEFEGVEEGNNTSGSSSDGNGKKYNGYLVSGTIEIPKTNLKCPIIAQSDYSLTALETSVVEIYGPGLNQQGNTTISGHNYRNGLFFSNNKKLNVGDKIYITDATGKKITYTIYDKFETTENDADYMTRDTQGAIEISLTTCTDDSKARLIILAKANG